MIINQREFHIKGLEYKVRSAVEADAEQLSPLRVQIDGETENMDRESGEGFIDVAGFEEIIKEDTEAKGNLFLVAEVDGRIVGFSRCVGSSFKRSAHKVEFGICVSKEFWGFGIGKNLLKVSLDWSDSTGIERMVLYVLETNEKAIALYESLGFEVEGVLRKDKLLADGKYYNTIVMGRLKD